MSLNPSLLKSAVPTRNRMGRSAVAISWSQFFAPEVSLAIHHTRRSSFVKRTSSELAPCILSSRLCVLCVLRGESPFCQDVGPLVGTDLCPCCQILRS